MTQLISDDYVLLNKELHNNGDFGVSGYKWATSIGWLILNNKINSLLDYGAGQQTLKKAISTNISIEINCYDPAIPELSNRPNPSEFVSCTDVLEHIEPDNIDAVLDDICSLVQRYVFLVIPTGPAQKILSDGRNAHLIQKPVDWWLPKLLDRFDLISLNNQSEDIVFFGAKKSVGSNEIQILIEDFLKEQSNARLLSIGFDGACLTFAIKEKKLYKRLLPRFISILKLGKRIGVVQRWKSTNRPPFSVVIRY